jgi:hypothetical protein
MSDNNQISPKMIRQTIFEVTKDNLYSFDVDETTTFHELKKILCNAAHLRKGSFRIYYNDKDFTYDYDNQKIMDIFPNEQKIYFTLFLIQNFKEEEDYSIKIDANSPCSIHEGKYLIFYCYTCKKSICKNCFDESHKNHNVKEKYDYLAPTKLLIDRIFSDSLQFYADEKYDKTFVASELKERLNRVIFDQLKKMIDQIANQLNDVIDYFNNYVVETRENTNENISRLKDFSIDAYKALKADINTNKIMINDDIFLTLDQKIKEIEQSKSILRNNANKYLEINTNFEKIQSLVNQIYTDIYNILHEKLGLTIYNEIKNNIRKSIVYPILKDDIMKKMFSNIKVARKSLNQKDPDVSQYNSSNIKSNNYERTTLINDNINNSNYQTQNINTSQYLYSQTQNDNTDYFKRNLQNQNYSNTQVTNNQYTQNLNNSQDNINTKIKTSDNTNYNQPHFIENLNNAILNSASKKSIIEESIEINSKYPNQRNSNISTDVFLYPIENTNKIMIQNIQGCEEREINFPLIGNLTSFLEKCAFCNKNNILYISGGIEKNGSYSNIFLKFDPFSKSLSLNSQLIKPRANHSMIAYNNTIYAIGGIDTNKCEKYNDIKWESMPDLIEKEVQLPMLFIYKDFLYAFGGLNKNNYLSTIERINLRNNRSKWEIVSYLNPENIDNKVIGCGLIESNNELLFLGGKKENNNLLKNSFKYNLLNNTYYNSDITFPTDIYFKECTFRKIGDHVYGNINENGKSPLIFDFDNSV